LPKRRKNMRRPLPWIIAFVAFCLLMAPYLQAQEKPTSIWWVHASVAAHMMSAAQDALSSWKMAEANPLYVTQTGPQAGHFYHTGAGRMAGATLGICAISEVVAHFKPRWRKYIAALNFGAAAAHVGVTTSNVVRNPYYR
jgi:hypothetical protein